jgi:hypothetical protein
VGKIKETLDALGLNGLVVLVVVALVGFIVYQASNQNGEGVFGGGFDPQFLNQPETPEMRWLRWAQTIELRVATLERGHDEHHANPAPVANPAGASSEPAAKAEHEHQDE